MKRGKNYNEREREEWNEKSNHAILLELRDSHQNKWTKCKTDKKGGEGVKKP